MYGNVSIIDKSSKDPLAGEDPVLLAEFEAKIARGEKIEANDWMPKEYRRLFYRNRFHLNPFADSVPGSRCKMRS